VRSAAVRSAVVGSAVVGSAVVGSAAMWSAAVPSSPIPSSPSLPACRAHRRCFCTFNKCEFAKSLYLTKTCPSQVGLPSDTLAARCWPWLRRLCRTDPAWCTLGGSRLCTAHWVCSIPGRGTAWGGDGAGGAWAFLSPLQAPARESRQQQKGLLPSPGSLFGARLRQRLWPLEMPLVSA